MRHQRARYESERVIQSNMQQIARQDGHHQSPPPLYIRRSDRIITIDRGRIVEDGTHDELVRTGGRYATLHRCRPASMKSLTPSHRPRRRGPPRDF